jgi:hypothetical protein
MAQREVVGYVERSNWPEIHWLPNKRQVALCDRRVKPLWRQDDEAFRSYRACVACKHEDGRVRCAATAATES